MKSDFEIKKVRQELFVLRRRVDTGYFNEGLYFDRHEISDIVHQLMFYIPDSEAF